ncbi:biopolymer transporter ExbD [Leptospira semungkisensis]|uniref:Biopolymer transporter ExbD n=1 Tax=Leptospira semungkisensis TaxID=2484985 RepID=A0A4R9FYL7_9LEPT|nr:biopolymer transporter ExbD [Leptospira semungkisensis]TGK03961.1 biopolymer transporter ExbD [Leptospira semungkisensis]
MRKSLLKEEETGIDLTSFIDVVFILLIFVMLAVSFRKEIRSIPLELPKIGQGEDPKGERIEFGMLGEGRFSLNGERLDRQALEAKLHSGFVNGKEVRFFAGESANYGETVRALDLLRRSGTSSLELAVQGTK